MNHKFSLMVLLALVSICLGLVRAMPAQTPNPGPEYDTLAVLIGEWNTEGELTENPFGPPEKWTGKVTYEWFPGKFAVISHQYTKSSVNGERHEFNVWGYDSAAKSYTWYGIDNLGMNFFVGKMSISGDVLTAEWETQAKGKTYKLRATTTGWGSDKVTNIQEYSEDGKVWKATYRSTETKVKSNKARNTGTALFTGRVDTVTLSQGRTVYRCQYQYAARAFWRTSNSLPCPQSAEVH